MLAHIGALTVHHHELVRTQGSPPGHDAPAVLGRQFLAGNRIEEFPVPEHLSPDAAIVTRKFSKKTIHVSGDGRTGLLASTVMVTGCALATVRNTADDHRRQRDFQ